MEELTDAVFRKLVFELGPPDVFFTEFVRAEDINFHRNITAQRRAQADGLTPGIPLVAQIYGTQPEAFLKGARELASRGFNGIDINMGCPAKRIRARGAGSGLIRTPSRAKEILLATREGAGLTPVSVKTRAGYDHWITEEWIGFLLEMDIPMLTLHARTAVQVYSGQADWEQIRLAVRLRDSMKKTTLITGNGDITDKESGKELQARSGCDGLMAGRAVLANPWFWSRKYSDKNFVLPEERVLVALRHLKLFEDFYSGSRNFHLMKKFIHSYLQGNPGYQENKKMILGSDSSEELKKNLLKYGEIF